MVSASLAFIVFTWYTPTASSATRPSPWRTDSTPKMNYVSCDIATDFIYNTNSNMLSDATCNATLAFGYINEFIDDSFTTYKPSMHIVDTSTSTGEPPPPGSCVSANASYVSEMTHRIAVHISNTLRRLQTYVDRLQYALTSVSACLRSDCTAIRYNTEHYSTQQAVYSHVSLAGVMMSLLTPPASSPTSNLLKGVARVVNLGLSTTVRLRPLETSRFELSI